MRRCRARRDNTLATWRRARTGPVRVPTPQPQPQPTPCFRVMAACPRAA